MAVTYTLTGEPTPVTEAGYPNGALIYNTGAAPAYASEDPGGQVTGFPVPAAGGSLTWDAGRPLYLATAPGQTTTVSVDDNSSSTVSSPTDLANAIIAGGLAQQIADQINAVGVPPIDAPALLYTKTATLGPSGSWNLGFDTSTWIDISRYQSLYVHVVANAKGTTGLNDTFVSSVYMMPSTSAPFGSALALETCECALTNVGATDANGSWSHMTVPAQGAGLALGLQVFTSTGAGSYNTNYTITVYGSYRSVTDLKIIAQNQSLINSLDSPTLPGMDSMHYSMNVTIPASSGQSFSLSYINAPFQFSYTLLSGAVTTGSDIYISSATPNRQYAGVYADKTPAYSIQRWEGLFTGGSMPRLWINNKDTVAKQYNLYFSFQR